MIVFNRFISGIKLEPSTEVSEVNARGAFFAVGNSAFVPSVTAAEMDEASESPEVRLKVMQSRTLLNKTVIKVQEQRNQICDSSSEHVVKKVRTYFDSLANARLMAVNSRAVPDWNRVLIKRKQDDTRNAQQLSRFYCPLFKGVTGRESLMTLLVKLANEKENLHLFSYRSDVKRDLFEVVTKREADCESLATIFRILADACGAHVPEYHSFSTPASFLRTDIPGIKPDELGRSITFARHTILMCNEDSDQTKYFDPVFGKQVDPDFYGVDVDRYLMRKPIEQ